MTPREKAENLHDLLSRYPTSLHNYAHRIEILTTALQQAADEQSERDRARIAELEAEVERALERIQTQVWTIGHLEKRISEQRKDIISANERIGAALELHRVDCDDD